MTKSCLIISGGVFSPLPENYSGADYVIACDKGWQYAGKLGIRPDLIIGDFDSSDMPDPGGELGHAPAALIERFPVKKDDTDTMLAARRALEKGCSDILICCAFGGRLDHTLANIQTAAFLVSNGARVRLSGEGADAAAFTNGTERFPALKGHSLSVFALSDECKGVTIRKAKYCCENVTLTNSFPLGVSNAWEEGEAEISVKNGILLVMMSKT